MIYSFFSLNFFQNLYQNFFSIRIDNVQTRKIKEIALVLDSKQTSEADPQTTSQINARKLPSVIENLLQNQFILSSKIKALIKKNDPEATNELNSIWQQLKSIPFKMTKIDYVFSKNIDQKNFPSSAISEKIAAFLKISKENENEIDLFFQNKFVENLLEEAYKQGEAIDTLYASINLSANQQQEKLELLKIEVDLMGQQINEIKNPLSSKNESNLKRITEENLLKIEMFQVYERPQIQPKINIKPSHESLNPYLDCNIVTTLKDIAQSDVENINQETDALSDKFRSDAEEVLQQLNPSFAVTESNQPDRDHDLIKAQKYFKKAQQFMANYEKNQSLENKHLSPACEIENSNEGILEDGYESDSFFEDDESFNDESFNDWLNTDFQDKLNNDSSIEEVDTEIPEMRAYLEKEDHLEEIKSQFRIIAHQIVELTNSKSGCSIEELHALDAELLDLMDQWTHQSPGFLTRLPKEITDLYILANGSIELYCDSWNVNNEIDSVKDPIKNALNYLNSKREQLISKQFPASENDEDVELDAFYRELNRIKEKN